MKSLSISLATLFRPIEGQSEPFATDRLWLLPWHIPPIPKSTRQVARQGVQTMEQLAIALRKLREAARLLAAANERALADDAKALADQVDRKNVQ